LYSINEKDASVALQNVQSFGTEGRETNGTFVPPQDAVHPYLVFRGPDIKDLHVHERLPNLPSPPPPPPPIPPPAAMTEPEMISPTTRTVDNPEEIDGAKNISTEITTNAENSNDDVKTSEESIEEKKTPSKTSRNNIKRTNRPKKQQQSLQGSQSAPVGTGASLLTRRERGSHNSNPQVMKTSNSSSRPEVPSDDFDFQSNLANFEKEEQKKDMDEKDANASEKIAYAKDDFFDSLSCDALDKVKGVDNRLRSSQERTLNAETFGAFALDSYRRSTSGGGGRGRGGRSGGRTVNNYYNSNGRGSGRGGGRGRSERDGGRGRGRGGRGRSRYRGDGNLPPEKKLVSA
jgi:protein LSM14